MVDSRAIPEDATIREPTPPRLSVYCVAYQRYESMPVLVHAFMCQSFQDFRLVVINDGEDPRMTEILARLKALYPERLDFFSTPKRYNDYGHTLREMAIEQCASEFILLTNHDNYYPPVFLEEMFAKIDALGLDLVLCDMIHSHNVPGQGPYRAFVTEPRKYKADIGCFIVKTALAKAVGFRDKTHDGDGTFIDDIMWNSGRVVNWSKVDKILFVHN